MDDFEKLLEKKRDLVEIYEKRKNCSKQNAQTADKNASNFDLIKMINKLISLTIKESLNIEFCPSEKKEDIIRQCEKIDKNFITYEVVSRTGKDEIKPRIRQQVCESVTDKENERIGNVYGKKFNSIIQFNIFSPSHEKAETIMEKFEELMDTYTGYFKKNGIAEMYFEKQLVDEHYDIYREKLSVRNIQYRVVTERLSVIFIEKVKEIETLMSEEEA